MRDRVIGFAIGFGVVAVLGVAWTWGGGDGAEERDLVEDCRELRESLPMTTGLYQLAENATRLAEAGCQ